MANRKTLVWYVVCAIVIIASYFIPTTELLTRAGIKTIALMLVFLILAVSEVIPLILICLLILGLMTVLGAVPSFNAALSGYANQVVFFVFASCGIASAITTVPLAKRVLVLLLKAFGKNVKSMIFAIMLGAVIISSCVSSVPTCAIFMAIGLSFLELYKVEDERKRTGRTLMIAIPVAIMIGSMMTPAGSSINLLAISLLEQYTNETITFVQWMAAGIPLTVVILPIAWFLMVKVYKPAEIDSKAVKDFINTLNVPKKIGKDERKVVIIFLVMLVLWILSSWIRSINIMVVALVGCCVLMWPRFGVVELKEFIKNNNWDPFFLLGSVLSLGAAMVSNGVSDWIISLMPVLKSSPFVLVGFVVLLMFTLLVVMPVAPSTVTIMATPLIALAVSANVSPALIMLATGLCAVNCYLIPLDTVPILTYGTGYYKMTDMPKSTLILQLIIIVIMAIWLPIIGAAFGWI